MTKYVLHGGNSSVNNIDNDNFFREMTRGLDRNITVLLNYFSREDNEIEKCAEQDKKQFLAQSENKNLTFIIANEKDLEQQLKTADVFYIRGGETAKLVKKMRVIPHIKHLFEGKVIGGSSAGVYVLAKYYWENEINIIGEGLGVFDIKAFCHYTQQDLPLIKQLLAYKESLPLLTLESYRWIVVYR